MMKRRSSNTSSPLAALALLLLVRFSFFHCTAAARLLPAVPPSSHQENNGVKAGAADGLVLDQMMGAGETDEPAACEEGNVDECLQRRLLRDAHLDYIYTQHKGKP